MKYHTNNKTYLGFIQHGINTIHLSKPNQNTTGLFFMYYIRLQGAVMCPQPVLCTSPGVVIQSVFAVDAEKLVTCVVS